MKIMKVLKNDTQKEQKHTGEITQLILNFPMKEDYSIIDKIACYADKISNYGCSGGGLKIKRMPLTQEDERSFGMEFYDEIAEYTYDYTRKPIENKT